MASPVRGLTHVKGVHGRQRLRESSSAGMALAYPYGPWDSPDFHGNGWLSPGQLGGVWGFPRERSKSHPAEPGGILTETEWRGSMLLSRSLCERNELAIGFLGHIANFVNGDGCKWEVVLRGAKPGAVLLGDTDTTDPAVTRCQEYLDEWRAFAGWGEGAHPFEADDLDGPDPSAPMDYQREAVVRASRDGECLLRFFEGGPGDDGLPSIRFVNPEVCRSPSGASPDSEWYMGVKSVKNDSERRAAYFFAEDLDATEGEVVDAGRVAHLPANVDGCVKRGVSDFFSVSESLQVIRRILGNIGETTAALSNYLAITEHAPGVTGDAVRELISGEATHQAPGFTPPSWGGVSSIFQPHGVKQLRGPTVEHVGNGTKVGNVPSVHSDAFIATVQAKLRAAGMRWGAPEYFSGDASNANFASTQVAGGPFVRAVEARQSDVCRFEAGVAMRVLAFGVRSGRLRADDLRRVTVNVNPSTVAIANRKEETDRRMALLQAKVVSPQTIAQEEGYDPKVESANNKAWAAANPPPDPLGGMGGAPVPGQPQPPGGGAGGLLESVGPPPHPGLVFDKGKHRWVRPRDATDDRPKPHFHSEYVSDGFGDRARQLRGMVNAYRRGEMPLAEFADKVNRWEKNTRAGLKSFYKDARESTVARLAADFGDIGDHADDVRGAFSVAAHRVISQAGDLAEYARRFTSDDENTNHADLAASFESTIGEASAAAQAGQNVIWDAIQGVRDDLAGDRKGEFKLGRYFESVNADDPHLIAGPDGLIYEAVGKAPFTGRRTNSLGHVHCYSAGKHVPCHTLGDDHEASGARQNAERVLKDPASASPDDIRDLVATLRKLTDAERKQLAAKYGATHKGRIREDRVRALTAWATSKTSAPVPAGARAAAPVADAVPAKAPAPDAPAKDPAPVDPADPPKLAAAMKSVGQALPSWNGQPFDSKAGSWDSHKVLISDLYDAMKDRLPAGTSLDDFKARLVADHPMALHRNDLQHLAKDPAAAQRSSTPNRVGQPHSYHVVDVTQLKGVAATDPPGPTQSPNNPPTTVDNSPSPGDTTSVGPGGPAPSSTGGGKMTTEKPTIWVQHAKGYERGGGRLSRKSYVARVDGLDDRYGLSRDFLDADRTDWGDSELYRKSKGTYHTEHEVTAGVYEVNEHGDRTYHVFAPVGGGLKEFRVNGDALKSAYRLLADAGRDHDEITAAFAATADRKLKTDDRVRAYLGQDVAPPAPPPPPPADDAGAAEAELKRGGMNTAAARGDLEALRGTNATREQVRAAAHGAFDVHEWALVAKMIGADVGPGEHPLDAMARHLAGAGK